MSMTIDRPPPSFRQLVIAGSISGMSSVIVCHPLDTIRTRLQHSSSSSFSTVVGTTLRHEGLRGLYKGFFPPFFSQAVYKSVIFSVQGRARSFMSTHMDRPSPLFLSTCAGAIAGGINAFLVAPVELVRNRLQIQQQDTANAKYKGSIDVIRQVTKHEGPMALWKGLSCTITRDALGVAFYFVTFDCIKTVLPDDWAPASRVLVAGASGGIAFWTIALPFDTVKTVIQVSAHEAGTQPHGMIRTGLHLVRQHGVGRVFQGWQAAFSRGIPGAAITFWAYGTTMAHLQDDHASLA
ncbi:hypothetical protein H310_05272 [Aphanomyces invadans]|uniref:Uncharacterized protein n=1 Tax=Aphanomyces invadans TaxID=157072 RepID=A0A024U8N0_9STRA|nr:hypothetical protein H310_05272 [Aphanomyces invadans]ETW02781.1 hypothetical protein H310_05272 [Aphanomyces invadans]|eukprot:XP_008868165.1 hypothetical protein H310_05272 [Aphanomyces invadans]